MTDTMISQNIDLSSWDILYIKSTNTYNFFETYCTISVYSSTKCRVVHNIIFFGS